MDELIQRISTMNLRELQAVMQAVTERYRAAYPQWDVVYMALHKDPKLREQEFLELMELIASCAEIQAEELIRQRIESLDN